MRPARTVADRREGVVRAMAAGGLDPAAALLDVVVASDGGADAADAAVDGLLAVPDPPTAVLCVNDLAAFGVMRGPHRHGVDVPGRMSVIGYDDVPFAAALRPALTTVRQPAYDLGRTAAGLLLAEPHPGHRHHERLLRPELVVRASTARRSR